jgi:RHS repeat-associated protein
VNRIVIGSDTFDFSYDANGNLFSGPDLSDPLQPATRTVLYNPENFPTEISRTVNSQAAEVTQFYYDGDNNRVKKSVNIGSTTYYFDDTYEVVDDVSTIYIYAANLRVAKWTNDGISYFHKDHLGSSTLITDQSGTAVQSSSYAPYGLDREPSNTGVSSYKFNDQEQDSSTNLYNYNARHYDPATGQFISPDSIIPDVYDPQQLNRYAYARNNPLKYTDPSGHILYDIIDVISFVDSAVTFIKDPSLANGAMLAMDTAGLLPGVPGAGTVKMGIKATSKIIDATKAVKAGKKAKTAATKVDDVIKSGRKGKQARLKELADDPKVSNSDRGWINQEKNAIKRKSKNQKGNEKKHIRNPPGKDLAHERGREAAKGFDYQHSKLQDRDLHKKQHKFDNNGKNNKKRPLDE